MEYNQKFILNQSLVIFAFGYAINDYKVPAILVAIVAIGMAIHLCGKKRAMRVFSHSLLPFVILCVVAYKTTLLIVYPTLAWAFLASMISMKAFEHYPSSTYCAVSIFELFMMCFTIVGLCLLKGVWPITLWNAILITLSAYLPGVWIYMKARIREFKIQLAIKDSWKKAM